jgi:hypothetical protein
MVQLKTVISKNIIAKRSTAKKVPLIDEQSNKFLW